MRKLLLTLLPTLALSAQAISIFEANNGDTISASISEKDLTRIEIEGQKISRTMHLIWTISDLRS